MLTSTGNISGTVNLYAEIFRVSSRRVIVFVSAKMKKIETSLFFHPACTCLTLKKNGSYNLDPSAVFSRRGHERPSSKNMYNNKEKQ